MDDTGPEALLEELLLLLEAQTEALQFADLRQTSPEQLVEHRERYERIKELLNRLGLQSSGDPTSEP